MTSEAVVSLFTASLAATERALEEESARLATATTRIHELEMELLLARAESDQWRNRFERECERRAWESERRELQSHGPAAQQSGAGDNPSTSHTIHPAKPDEESEEAQAPQEPSPPATPLKPNDPTLSVTATLQEPPSLHAASPTVEPVTSPPSPATPYSHRVMSRPEESRPVSSRPLPSLLSLTPLTPALPRVEQLGPMLVKVFIEQERYPTTINLVGRVIGPNCATLKSIEADSGCAVRVIAESPKSAYRGPPFVLIRRRGPASCQADLAKLHDAAARVQKILTPPPHGRDELWQQQQQELREMDAARGACVRLPKTVGSRSTPALVRPIEECPVPSPPPSSLPHFTSPAEPQPLFPRKPALPRVEQLGAMTVKVFIEQERYPTTVNLVGRVLGPGCTTIKSIKSVTGCLLNVFCAQTMSQFRGAPYVVVRREGRACREGVEKVHDAVVLVQHILTPPLHGRDELWLQQQQRLRVRDAERAAASRVQQAKPLASRSTPAVVRPCEARLASSPPPSSLPQLYRPAEPPRFSFTPDQQTTLAFGSRSTPAVARPSEARETTGDQPSFGTRSTTTAVRPSEARETTDDQATPPAFGTRSGMIPLQQLQEKLPQQQHLQQVQQLQPKEKQSKPRQQQEQSGRKEAPIGIWRL